jgi:cell division protein FtsZ
MGGGTGTGASPIVASVAKEMGILTVGIVTIPFAFEGVKKIQKAMAGVAELAEQVDAIVVINNEKLRQIYADLNLLNAFSKSDDVVANAARSIAEIITKPGYINTDFTDVYNTLKDGGVAIMSVGTASGENRVANAIHQALHSPLINTDVHGASRLLLQIYCSTEQAMIMSEIDQIHDFVREVGDDVEVQWGAALDETLGESVRVTIIATGYEVSDIPTKDAGEIKRSIDSYYEKVTDEQYDVNENDVDASTENQLFVEPVREEEHDLIEDSPAIELELEVPNVIETVNVVHNDEVQEEEIVVQIDEEENDQKQGTLFNLPGWMRGRR